MYPTLQRLSGLQWVNQGFATQFGRGGPHDFEDPNYIEKLAAPPMNGVDTHAELRRQVLNSFRIPSGGDGNQLPWPWVYGDGMQVPAANSPQQNAAISPTQYHVLQRWVLGDFLPDWKQTPEAPRSLEDVPLAEQPAMLDRAALDHCLADAFHPGCEVTWPIRHLSMYSAPYRIRHRPAGTPEPDYGKELTPEIALSPDGPLNEQGPGDLTKWMGLPWQADTAYCRSGYDSDYDPYVPTFWPARVPNQVLSPAAYAIICDENIPREQRLAVYNDRTEWVAPLTGTTAGQMEEMVRVFGSMGLLEPKPGVENDADFPPEMLVASFGPDIPEPAAPETHPPLAAAPPEAGQPAPRRIGWGTQQERDNAPLTVRHPKSNR